MRKHGAGRHIRVLLATTCLITAWKLGASGAAAQDSGANGKDANAQSVILDPINVQGNTSGNTGYIATRTSVATKTDTPLINIPQSISVLTKDFIKYQSFKGLTDVTRYVPGVAVHQGEGNRDELVIRGVDSSANFFVNGFRDDVQYYRDLYNLTRVEVLRGPNAMIFGRGAGGGLINRVTKQAGFMPLREFTFQVGSFGDLRATIDLNQPLNSQTAVRLNAMYEDSDSFRDFVELHRFAVNPTLTFAPSAQTKLMVGYEHLHDTRTADRGVTSFQGRPADVPINTYYGNPADSHVRATVDLLSASFEYQAGELTLRNHTLFGGYDRGYQNYVPGAVNAAQTQVTLTAYNNATKRENLFNQTDLTTTITTGEIKHTLLGGVELGRQWTDNFRNTGYFDNATTSLLVPYDNPLITTPVTFRQSGTDADNHLDTTVAAIYVQDQVDFSKQWQAIAGLRFDAFGLDYHNNRDGSSLSRDDNLFSPRAGLIFKPVAEASLYASYSVSYLPSSGDQFSSLTVITQQVEPEKFTNCELGAKWDLTPKFSLTSAFYQLDRTNTRSTDPTDPTRIIQTGSTRTNGFEFGVNGSVTTDWSVAGGYAYQDAFIRSATTAAAAGAQVAQVPHHNFSLWNKYQITRQRGAGVGVIYRSKMFAGVDNTVTLPGYTRVDAAVYYVFNRQWRLQANVENLGNTRYFINADSNTNISPGSSRAVRVMLRAFF